MADGWISKIWNAGSSTKGQPSDAKKVAGAVPGGKAIRNRNGYGAYQIARQEQGKPVLSLADWMAGKADDDEDNALTTRLR